MRTSLGRYGISRSYHKGADTRARRAHFLKDEVEAMCRWRTFEEAKRKRPREPMADHYADARELAPLTWKLVYALWRGSFGQELLGGIAAKHRLLGHVVQARRLLHWGIYWTEFLVGYAKMGLALDLTFGKILRKSFHKLDRATVQKPSCFVTISVWDLQYQFWS